MNQILRYSVIATQVENLTDARYFAARGTDYLLYDLEEVTVDLVRQIQEWVSGSQTLLLFSETNLQILDEAVIKLQPAGIAMKGGSHELQHLAGHVAIFDWTDDEIDWMETKYVSYDLHQGREDYGIILRGGDEAMIGVKSYEELDEIFDAIEY